MKSINDVAYEWIKKKRKKNMQIIKIKFFWKKKVLKEISDELLLNSLILKAKKAVAVISNYTVIVYLIFAVNIL